MRVSHPLLRDTLSISDPTLGVLDVPIFRFPQSDSVQRLVSDTWLYKDVSAECPGIQTSAVRFVRETRKNNARGVQHSPACEVSVQIGSFFQARQE